MIIKVIECKKSEKSRFDRLGRYILNAKDNESILFARTARYIMDEKKDGEKVAWYRISNCQSNTPAVAIAEVLTTQAENQRAKSDKTYRLVVSLPHWAGNTFCQSWRTRSAPARRVFFELAK